MLLGAVSHAAHSQSYSGPAGQAGALFLYDCFAGARGAVESSGRPARGSASRKIACGRCSSHDVSSSVQGYRPAHFPHFSGLKRTKSDGSRRGLSAFDTLHELANAWFDKSSQSAGRGRQAFPLSIAGLTFRARSVRILRGSRGPKLLCQRSRNRG